MGAEGSLNGEGLGGVKGGGGVSRGGWLKLTKAHKIERPNPMPNTLMVMRKDLNGNSMWQGKLIQRGNKKKKVGFLEEPQTDTTDHAYVQELENCRCKKIALERGKE